MRIENDIAWLIVAAGLIAHADSEFDWHECAHLMTTLDDHVSTEDLGSWLACLNDPDAIRSRMDELEPLGTDDAARMLEKAWTIADADGRRSASEVRVAREVGQRLGLSPERIARCLGLRDAA